MSLTTNEPPKWPIGAILGYGTLGAGTPAGRRYHRRSGIALLLLVGCMLLGAALPKSALHWALPMAPGLVFLYIVYEFRRYLLELDELARRMHMEAMAWTYLTGLAVAMFIGGLSVQTGWQVNPMWFIVLEPVRGAFLYLVSRRY